MRALIFSDLHTELRRAGEPLPVPDTDICLCAGDVCDNGPASAVSYLGEHVSAKMPVMLVAGNHDYHRSSIVEGRREARLRADAFPDVHFLDRDVAIVGGYRFVGATLWGGVDLSVSPRAALYLARGEAEDCRKIKMSRNPATALSRARIEALKSDDMVFLKEALGEGGPFPRWWSPTTHRAGFRSSRSLWSSLGKRPVPGYSRPRCSGTVPWFGCRGTFTTGATTASPRRGSSATRVAAPRDRCSISIGKLSSISTGPEPSDGRKLPQET
ncbi:hypothetical protein HJC05_20105 [Rhizobium sp. NLR9a]|uniref:metallophosphoesterase n=1 Tax=unclassified Rhizobium TaxID=2613769 RepID=UPI001C8400C7|nr:MULTISPECIES: metallophosphoesterase [unclassified Rhizobium]MBX5216494.1 hypothetical protein [Rhizobium sp. NLR9a]MBX5277824.1 hypothetical protein [Rhizobium sp. NLR13a]